MPKKKQEQDPLIESLMGALRELFTGIVCHAVVELGPDGALQTVDGIIANMVEQRGELAKTADDFIRNQNAQTNP